MRTHVMRPHGDTESLPMYMTQQGARSTACRTAGFSRPDSERDRSRRGGRGLPASAGPQWRSSVPPHVEPAKAGGPGQTLSKGCRRLNRYIAAESTGIAVVIADARSPAGIYPSSET